MPSINTCSLMFIVNPYDSKMLSKTKILKTREVLSDARRKPDLEEDAKKIKQISKYVQT